MMLTVNLFHLTRSRWQSRVYIIPVQTGTTGHPSRFQELQDTSILTRMFRFLYTRRFVLMLTNHMFRRSKRNINFLIRRMAARILQDIFLLPSTRTRSIDRKVFTLMRRRIIRSLLPNNNLTRRVSTVNRANTRDIHRRSTRHSIHNGCINRSTTRPVYNITSYTNTIRNFSR